jgi:hypothetical protein
MGCHSAARLDSTAGRSGKAPHADAASGPVMQPATVPVTLGMKRPFPRTRIAAGNRLKGIDVSLSRYASAVAGQAMNAAYNVVIDALGQNTYLLGVAS